MRIRWVDEIVHREALRDDGGRVIGGSDDRGAGEILEGGGTSPVNVLERLGLSSQVAHKMLRFLGQLVRLPTLTAQRVALLIIQGKHDNDEIARILHLSRVTVWRVRRKLEADPFWSQILVPKIEKRKNKKHSHK